MRSRPSSLVGLTLVAVLLLPHLLLPATARAETAPHEAGTVSAATERTGVEGRVVRNEKPLAGLRVHAYLDAAGGFQGEGYASSDPTTAKGLFTLVLPPGRYYLVAKGSVSTSSPSGPDPGEYFGYYGSNPITVFPGIMTTRNIPAAPRTPPVVTPDAQSDIMMPLKGVVLGPEGPVEGATIHVYTDASQQFRGPDMFGPQGAVSGGTDAKGAFSTELPAGAFYLVAAKRMGGATLGQLQIGDLHGYYNGNPLRIIKGTSTSVVIRVEEKLREPLATTAAAGAITGIRGTIRDLSGNVPPRTFVYITTDPSFLLGSMPTLRSQFLEQDGSYFAEVSEGGTYYVFARSGYGGPPLAGEWNGFYGDKDPRPVVVPTGTLVEGIDFVVKKTQ